MKTYTYSYQNGPCRGASQRPRHVPGQTWLASLTPWHVACRGRWVESNAGMSHAAAAGSKVTLACRMPRPLGRK